jgi:hypothetical protein
MALAKTSAVRSLQRDLVAEHDEDAAVADGERDRLASPHAPLVDDRAEREDERRVEIEDETLEAGRDVDEAGEVEKARQVVAAEAETGADEPVATRQRRPASPGPPGEQREQWQREQHAVHDQRHRVDAVAIRELDDDRLARERDRSGHRERQARPQGGARRRRGNGRRRGDDRLARHRRAVP